MRTSKYTFLFTIEECSYLYSTLTNSLVEVDDAVLEELRCARRESRNIDESIFDEDTIKVLIDKRFVAENDFDEFLSYKRNIVSRRSSDGELNITIAPTMDCNYSCHYCFEERRDSYMTDEVQESIVRFVRKQDHTNQVKIQWFGGEPLLAIDRIKALYRELKAIEGKQYTSGIITNGFLLNDENIKALKELDISYLQITMDGLKETHNRIKYAEGCLDTFSVTLGNIDRVLELAPEIFVNIRVNINKENADEFVKLYGLLLERYGHNRNMMITPGIVQDFENNTLCRSSDCKLFAREDVMRFTSELWDRYEIKTHLALYPTNRYNECGIRNRNVLAFDPEGNVYKCWEIIGKEKYAVGKLEATGDISVVNVTMLNRYLYGADPIDDTKCQACSYLPVCHGGCPHHRIESKFEGKSMDTCTYLKGNLPELMRIHLGSKERVMAEGEGRC